MDAKRDGGNPSLNLNINNDHYLIKSITFLVTTLVAMPQNWSGLDTKAVIILIGSIVIN